MDTAVVVDSLLLQMIDRSGTSPRRLRHLRGTPSRTPSRILRMGFATWRMRFGSSPKWFPRGVIEMGKRTEQLIARALQAETHCSYALVLNKVRAKGEALVQAGSTWREALDLIATMSADELGIRGTK